MRQLGGDPIWTFQSEPSEGNCACIGVWGRHVYAVFCAPGQDGHFVTATDTVNLTTDLVAAKSPAMSLTRSCWRITGSSRRRGLDPCSGHEIRGYAAFGSVAGV
jgi:hypothetical protein